MQEADERCGLQLSDPYIRVKTGEANTYNITTEPPPVSEKKTVRFEELVVSGGSTY